MIERGLSGDRSYRSLEPDACNPDRDTAGAEDAEVERSGIRSNQDGTYRLLAL